MKLNKEYIIRTLEEEKLWEEGEADTFEYGDWELTLRKEEKNYSPFIFSLNGKKKNSLESWGRRYKDMEEVFLHVLNRFNENANVKNRYKTLADCIADL